VQTAVFLLLLITGGVFFFVLPKEAVSLVEKRRLAPLPVYTYDNLMSGIYADSLDLFFADNFPYRDHMVDLSFEMKEIRGIKSKNIAIYRNKYLGNNEFIGRALVAFNDTVADSMRNANEEGDLLGNGLFIYNGAALQLFGGSETMAKYYASVINKYHAELEGKVTIYNVIFPTPSEFYLPDEYRKLSRSEKPNIDAINANLSPGIKTADAYSLFKEHKYEYLYFRTDHHETVMGAYYAYCAFCSAAGLTPLDLTTLTRKVRRNYLGSLYSLTRDSRLLEKPDSVEYFIIPGTFKTSYFSHASQKKGTPGQMLYESSGGYGVFLGGDHPLTKIETGLKNGKRIVVVKNSFGNPFVPFLAAHYEQVFAVDYRYFSQGLLDFINANKVTDLVFINCTILANAKWHVQCINRLMKQGALPRSSANDSISKNMVKDTIVKKADSLKVK
jgi:hypothetical protein